MLEKNIVIDLIEVTESGIVQVREAARIIENGILLSESFHRHVIVPGQDYNKEDAEVQAICAVVHKPEVIAAYKATQEANVK